MILNTLDGGLVWHERVGSDRVKWREMITVVTPEGSSWKKLNKMLKSMMTPNKISLSEHEVQIWTYSIYTYVTKG